MKPQRPQSRRRTVLARWKVLLTGLALAAAGLAWYALKPDAPPPAPAALAALDTAPGSSAAARVGPAPAAARVADGGAGTRSAGPQPPGAPVVAGSGEPRAVQPADPATPAQQAAAQALVMASFDAPPPPPSVQPAPVLLRRSQRQQAGAAATPAAPLSAADTGLQAFPGALALPEQSGRQGHTATFTAQAFASFQDVRSFYAAQLQPSTDGTRQLTVQVDDGRVYDARLVDINRKTIQRAQLAAGDAFVVVQISCTDVR